jgi:apolipoprotein N-acyltransferase
LAFPPYGLSALSLLGVFCLLEISRLAPTPKRAFLWGLSLGVVSEVLLMHWLVYTVSVYGQFGWWLSAMIVIPLYAYLGAFFGLFSLFAHLYALRFKKTPSAFWLASVWVVLELVRSRFLGGFPWLLLGHALDPASTLAQASEIGGPLLGSFLLALLGATAWRAFHTRKRPARVLKAVWTGIACLALAFGFGIVKKLSFAKETAPKTTLRALLVQGNIPQDFKFDESKKFSVIDTYVNLTHAALQKTHEPPDLVVWPETALSFFFTPDFVARQYFLDRLFPLPSPLITGTIDAALDEPSGEWRYRNRVIVLNRAGRLMDVYDKVHLVPFGEYAPLPIIGRLVGEVGNFTPGRTVHPLRAGRLTIGTLVCYEAIFPGIASKMVSQGANVLLNLSNDAWFGKTSAPYQHLRIASYLATSLRLPLVRVTNTGISALILPSGEIQHASGLFKAWTSQVPIPVGKSGKTLYARFGEGWVLLIAAYALVSLKPLYRKRSLHSYD